MKGRVERLQWGLVAGTLLLLAVLAGTVGYSRWKAAQGWLKGAKQRAGVHLQRETDGFTYSQTMEGRTVFSLHAAKAFQHEAGIYTLHDVVLTVYGLKGDRADRIYGDEFDWDEPKGIARAQGEVRMDLGVDPKAALAARAGGAAALDVQNDAKSIHVKTRGLTFLRKLDVASTTEAVEFHYGALLCTATGAELDSKPSELHLLHDVHVEGTFDGDAAKMNAARADFARETNQVTLAQPVVDWGERKGKAAQAVLHLRADGTVETGVATGGVEMAEGTRTVRAERVETALNERNQLLNAVLKQGVRLVDVDKERPAEASAGEMRLRFGAGGVAEEVDGTGGVQMTERQQGAGGVWLVREARGEHVVAKLASVGVGKHKTAVLEQVHAAGGAMLRADALAKAAKGSVAGVKTTTVTADDLTSEFVRVGKDVKPAKLHGTGHTVLRETGPTRGEERVSQGDALEVAFAPGEGKQLEIASAEQTGHMSLRSVGLNKAGKPVVSTASGERARVEGGSDKVLLSGGAHVADNGTMLNAAEIAFDRVTGDAEASGGVTGTLLPAEAGGQAKSPTHVAAERAVMNRATGVATFTGSAGKAARMWQEASQVEATEIVVDKTKKTLAARPGGAGGVVRSVFAGERKPGASGVGSLLRVESRSLEYAEAARAATFDGPVRMDGASGDVRGGKAVVYLAPGTKGAADGTGLMTGGVDRVMVSGNVRLEQPGRQGTGEQVVYRAADGSVTLTGTAAAPPRVVDAQQGTLTGASLMMRPGDSTIVVSGSAAAENAGQGKTERRGRARIDTRVRQ